MTPRHPQGDRHPERDDQEGRGHIERHPVSDCPGVTREIGARRQLMSEGQRDGQVGVEVDEVPGLMGDAPPCGSHRGHRDQHEESRRDVGHQHVRVGGEEDPGLGGEGAPVGHRVAGRGEDDVAADEADGGESEPAVPAADPIDPEEVVQPRAARHQHHLDQRAVGAQQGGELPRPGEHRRRVGQIGELPVADPHPHDEEGVGGEDQQHVTGAQPPAARDALGPPGRRGRGSAQVRTHG